MLTRTIPIAGNAFTEAVQHALDLSEDDAAQVKENATQLVLSEEERATLDPTAQQASRALEPLLDEIIRELRRSLAYHDYQQQSPEAGAGELGVSRILLSGGSAKLPRIEDYLQAQLGVPAKVRAGLRARHAGGPESVLPGIPCPVAAGGDRAGDAGADAREKRGAGGR